MSSGYDTKYKYVFPVEGCRILDYDTEYKYVFPGKGYRILVYPYQDTVLNVVIDLDTGEIVHTEFEEHRISTSYEDNTLFDDNVSQELDSFLGEFVITDKGVD